MRIMIISSSPNKDGLTAACEEQARLGVTEAGAEAAVVRLNDQNIGKCHACDNGWGTCLKKNTCQVTDDFQEYHALMKDMDGFIFITPVYWGDMSESVKAFFDRVRRCEGFKKENQFLLGKPVICVAAAGGSGRGCLSCLTQFERFIEHMRAKLVDIVGITRWSREYKLKDIYNASAHLAKLPTEGQRG